jgi:AsmA protein
MLDINRPQASSVQVTLPALPADTFFDWLAVATPHPPTGLGGPGNLAGTIAWGTSPLPPRSADRPASTPSPAQQATASQSPQASPSWSGELEFSGATLDISPAAPQPIPLGDIILRSTPPAAPLPVKNRRQVTPPVAPAVTSVPDSFDLLPISLDLGGKDPLILDGHVDDSGYTLHLSGWAIPARLVAFAGAVPQLADGLRDTLQTLEILPPDHSPESPIIARGSTRGTVVPEVSAAATPIDADEPVRIDLTATRIWGNAQIWHQNAATSAKPRNRK